jgi:hypothetical protein
MTVQMLLTVCFEVPFMTVVASQKHEDPSRPRRRAYVARDHYLMKPASGADYCLTPPG